MVVFIIVFKVIVFIEFIIGNLSIKDYSYFIIQINVDYIIHIVFECHFLFWRYFDFNQN